MGNAFFDNIEANTRFFNQHGYWVEPNLYSDADCKSLISAALELNQSDSYPPIMMPHRKGEAFLSALKNRVVTQIIARLIGEDISGLQSQFFFSKKGTQGFSNHQDNFFVEAEYGKFMSAWAALVDVTPDDGGLIIYPGTHKEAILPTRKLERCNDSGQDINSSNEETVIPAKYQQMSVSLNRGDVLFIHGNLVHASHKNTQSSYRYSLLNTYIAKGRKFRPGKNARRSEVELTDEL